MDRVYWLYLWECTTVGFLDAHPWTSSRSQFHMELGFTKTKWLMMLATGFVLLLLALIWILHNICYGVCFWVGGRLGNWVWKFIDLCNCKGCCSYGALCTAVQSFAPVQFICSRAEIAKHNPSIHWWLRGGYASYLLDSLLLQAIKQWFPSLS